MTPRIAPDVLGLITAMREAGSSWAQIAAATGKTLEAIESLAVTYRLAGIGPPPFWNAGRKARAIQMAKDGYSASQIGSDLGCTRNAVVGKLGRAHVKLHGHSGNPHGNRTRRRPRPPNARAIAIQQGRAIVEDTTVDLPVEPPTSFWVFFRDLEPEHCRWPVAGEPGPMMRCCGAPRASEATSYCQFHYERGHIGYR